MVYSKYVESNGKLLKKFSYEEMTELLKKHECCRLSTKLTETSSKFKTYPELLFVAENVLIKPEYTSEQDSPKNTLNDLHFYKYVRDLKMVNLADLEVQPKRIYIAGKMGGVKDYNYPKFLKVGAELQAKGYQVENPADISVNPDWAWEDYMKVAIHKLLECDTLYVLQGFETSKGAFTEIQLAKALNKRILYETKVYIE